MKSREVKYLRTKKQNKGLSFYINEDAALFCRLKKRDIKNIKVYDEVCLVSISL